MQGAISSGTFATGDCLKLVYNQPYGASLTAYGAAGFYVPFPASTAYSLTTASPSATLVREDDYTLKLTLDSGGVTAVNFAVNSFTNPYSQLTKTEMTMKHYPGCGTSATDCTTAGCKHNGGITQFTAPTATLPTPSSAITTAAGTTANVVASVDGKFTISLTPGAEFPAYGGWF